MSGLAGSETEEDFFFFLQLFSVTVIHINSGMIYISAGYNTSCFSIQI